MGFVTPFPEPDSPDLRPFELSSRPEIVAVLRALCDDAPQLNVFVDGGPEFDLARLLDVDAAAGRIDCDLPLAFLGASSRPATFVGFVGPDKVQFETRPLAAAAGAEREALGLHLPASLLLMKRRKTERRVSESGAGWLRLAAGPWTDRPLPVCDLGAGGVAVEVAGAAELPPVGSQIDRCRLDLPGIGGAEVALAIRHCTIVPDGQGAVRLGCEFLKPRVGVEAMVARYLRSRVTPGDA